MKVKDSLEIKRKEIAKWPKVAIIILNWNNWKDTIECLESVFRNNYPNYQVIVVDNGSTDGSMEKIKAWAEGKQEVLTPEPTHPLYNLSHPPVKKPILYVYYTRGKAEKGGDTKKEDELIYKWRGEKNNEVSTRYSLILIQTGKNLGFAGGNNIGIRYTIAKKYFKYIWLLNNDTIIDKNALCYLIKKGEGNIYLGVIGLKLLFYYKPNVIQTAGGGKIIPWLGIQKSIGRNKKDEGEWDKEIILDYVSGASFLIRVSTINFVGLMDENYFLYWEETDWCERIKRECNKKMSYEWKSKVWHKESSTINSRSIIQDYYGTINGLIFMKKYYGETWILGAFISFIGKVFNRIRRRNYINLKVIVNAYIDFFCKKNE